MRPDSCEETGKSTWNRKEQPEQENIRIRRMVEERNGGNMSERRLLRNCPLSGFADEIDSRTDRQIEVLKQLGMSWVELRSADGVGIADMSLKQAGELKAGFQGSGIRVSAIGSPIGKIGVEGDFAPHLQQFEHVMELADIFETSYIRIFSFYIPAGREPASCRDEVMRRMEELVKRASFRGKVLLHENEKGIYGDMADRCLDLMQSFYGENFRCTFDFANFVQCGQDTLEAYEMLEPYIAYIHVKDAMRKDGRVVPAGEGDGKLGDILSRLDRKGYDGFLSLEPHLVDFGSLQSLEKNAEKRGRTDGAAAYAEAYRALTALLCRDAKGRPMEGV